MRGVGWWGMSFEKKVHRGKLGTCPKASLGAQPCGGRKFRDPA